MSLFIEQGKKHVTTITALRSRKYLNTLFVKFIKIVVEIPLLIKVGNSDI